MTARRRTTLALAIASLLLTALGLPASAADDKGTLAIVNGRPGAPVDICFGKREFRAGVPYGSYARKDVIRTGKLVVRFALQDGLPGCGGTRLGARVLQIGPGDDLTIVLTRKPPKVVIFDNTDPYFLGQIPPRGEDLTSAVFAWRSAADFTANFFYTWWAPNEERPIGPALNEVWSKGDEFAYGSAPDVYWRVRATLPERAPTLAQRTALTKASRRYEWILVGTRRANARFVLINRGVSLPT